MKTYKHRMVLSEGLIKKVRKLHDRAMDLAEMAEIARVKGDVGQAKSLLRQAYENELKVTNLLVNVSTPEPTRSALFCSAASLAFDCNEFREAERLIAIGFSSNTPPDIAKELRDLLWKITFHKDLFGE